ncbi:hypothetical protein L6164_024635 [Bauhinia variegata]|uniref:Uncharacterized protein n=1 Tax=Bauhinia variegata TaxID=167791 RepID=A0ACB9LXV6_BAUVA|nr:hypothetical protein L6164_024635 [Bauhinia variegata]
MSGGIVHRRLTEERKAWLKNHPLGINLCIFKAWKPAITVKQILVGIRDLLDRPNPAQTEGYRLFIEVLTLSPSTRARFPLYCFTRCQRQTTYDEGKYHVCIVEGCTPFDRLNFREMRSSALF